MKHIGEFNSARWGTVHARSGHYDGPKGPLAVVLVTDEGEPLATLSVNMYRPECSHDSKDLPPDCFYAKCWSENEEIAEEALQSGLFKLRRDLPRASSGYVVADAWQLSKGA